MHWNLEKNAEYASGLVAVTGRLTEVSSKNRKRLSAFLVNGKEVLSESPVSAGGTFQFHVAQQLAGAAGVAVVLGPKGLDEQSLASRTDLPRVALANAGEVENGALRIHFRVNDEIIDPWWIWCREYTVSGTLETSAGCPIGAQVTVYNVTTGVGGLVKTPIETVSTDANGNFAFSFNWCSRECWWPCWPIWWRCWPWWWELDILAVIENIERRLQAQNPALATVSLTNVAPLRQPDGADLMTGVGFAGVRANSVLQPDSARTALIAQKFNNPRLREIFPYWWWCCENPNLVFSASQGTVTVLDEDPNTSTRWCFASGQSVALTGNSESVGACPVTGGEGDCSFAWSSVGAIPGGTLVANITSGYADGGGDCSNLAFTGTLNLNGDILGSCVAYYQVLAGKWNGNPARGGTAPLSYQPLSETLVNDVTIWRDAVQSTQVYQNVVLGPFSFNGVDNLYTTPDMRQSGALPASVLAQIGAFPTLGPGDFVMGWATTTLIATPSAGDLVSPEAAGGATLVFNPFDASGNPIPTPSPATPPEFVLGPALTLMIDTTPLTTASIGTVTVYNSDGSLAQQASSSSTACPSYQIKTATGFALIPVSVTDNQGHICAYSINTEFGHGTSASATPTDREYTDPLSDFTPNSSTQLFGIDAGYSLPNTLPAATATVPPIPAWSFAGGGDIFQFEITESCCYDFQLLVQKRTTDGTNSCIQYVADFQTVNITVASGS